MYIPEFVCGAAAVVILEIVALVIVSLVRARRK